MNQNYYEDWKPIPSFVPEGVRDRVGNRPLGYNGDDAMSDVTATPIPSGDATPTASSGYTPLLPDLSKYDLSVQEAIELFPRYNRRRPSDRTIQRYCQDERFDCYKLKTTRSGTPVHEWIINSTSLSEFIKTKPEFSEASELATPSADGDARTSEYVEEGPDVMATPELVGDAGSDPVLPRSHEELPDDMATPAENGDAKLAGRGRVELLIENAELTARLDAKNELIGELRDDKSFLREQIVHQRRNDTLMADMHKETLQTLKAVAVAGRHTKIEMGEGAELPEPDFTVSDQSDQHFRQSHGV